MGQQKEYRPNVWSLAAVREGAPPPLGRTPLPNYATETLPKLRVPLLLAIEETLIDTPKTRHAHPRNTA